MRALEILRSNDLMNKAKNDNTFLIKEFEKTFNQALDDIRGRE